MGGGDIRGCAMPHLRTVTMKTDITPEEQYLAGLCGLEWYSQRLAQASRGYHSFFCKTRFPPRWCCITFQSSTGRAESFVLYLCKYESCQFVLTKTIRAAEGCEGRRKEAFIFNELLSSFVSL